LTSAARLGRDLLAENVAASAEAAARVTVEQLIERYVERRVRPRCRSAARIEQVLWNTLAPVLSKAAADIRRRDLRDLCDSKADEGFPHEAERRRITLGTMFRWAVGQDYIETNPASGLASYGRSKPRDRVLSDEEITVLWGWLESADLPDGYADVLKLQLLTGARCSEAGGITATEIDQVSWLWTLPAARSKNDRSRVVPLLGFARRIVKARLSLIQSGPLFATRSGQPLQATHLGNALNSRRRPVPIAKFTSHDLRRTAVTNLAELGIPLQTVAAIVGHEAGGPELRTLIRHYVRTDFLQAKTAALTAWDTRLRHLVGSPPRAANSESKLPVLAEIAAE
jgi:integrase